MFLRPRASLRSLLGITGAGLVMACLLFPLFTSMVVRPYVVTLDYRVLTDGVYALRFNRFVLLNPTTVFDSSVNAQALVEVANTGRAELSCWVSDYGFSAAEKLLGFPGPVLDQPDGRAGPGALLLNSGHPGAAGQPYRTLVLEPRARVVLSFHGGKRNIQCPPQPRTRVAVRSDGLGEIEQTLGGREFSADVTSSTRSRTRRVTLHLPPYAFGTFHVTGPEGFRLTQGTLRRLGSTVDMTWGWIPFPWAGLVLSLAGSWTLAALGYLLFRHAAHLFKALPLHEIHIDTPLLATRDWAFLAVSGSIVLTFTGSVPPVHMVDSVWYVETAARLPELFRSFAYPPYRSPGYPILIRALRGLMGPGYGLILVQQLLFFLSAFLLFKTVECLGRGNRVAAWAAGLLYALNPLNLIFSQFIQPEGLWRDLVVAWAFSLVLLLKRSRWAPLVAGSSLGLLWLSRNSALPLIVLCVATGCLLAWKRPSLSRYGLGVLGVIAVLNAPYQIYLRAAGTHGQAYFAAQHHALAFLVFDKTLDHTASCFSDMQQDFRDFSGREFPWMKLKILSPLNGKDPVTLYAVRKAEAFEGCVWQANYLRFPKQQLAVLGRRILSYLWSPALRDRDLWNYQEIYTRKFLPPEAPAIYSAHPLFLPYIYQEKWDVQDSPSAWKDVFNALYRWWPPIDLGILTLAAVALLLLHVDRCWTRRVDSGGTLELLTALAGLYVAEALLYASFGVVFPRRMMLAVAPLTLVAFGTIAGLVLHRGGAASRTAGS